jgi:hypothetical protein
VKKAAKLDALGKVLKELLANEVEDYSDKDKDEDGDHEKCVCPCCSKRCSYCPEDGDDDEEDESSES